MATLRDQLAALESELAGLGRDVNPRYRESLRKRIQNLRRAGLVAAASAAPSTGEAGLLQGLRSQATTPGMLGRAAALEMAPPTARPAPAPQPQAARSAAPPAPTIPAEPIGPLEAAQRVDERSGLAPTAEDLAKADLTPEIAALREAIRAPAPVFRGLAFSKGEQAALGFLAGLRGIEAVTPLIEMRRREAMTAYEAAREARAERIREASALVGLQREERQARRQQSERAEDVRFRERQFGEQVRGRQASERLTERGQDLALRGRREGIAAAGERRSRIPPSLATKLSKTLTSAKNAKAALDMFIQEGKPGGPISTLGTGLAITAAQRRFRPRFQVAIEKLRSDIAGAHFPPEEQKRLNGLLPEFGNVLDSTITGSLEAIQEASLREWRTALDALEASGADVEALRGLEAESGLLGIGGGGLLPQIDPEPEGSSDVGIEMEFGYAP